MAWNKDATFTGGSGQMAVMGELLHRKCNAAIPHVDIGMDIFAFRDDCEDVARIQVKTAPGKPLKNKLDYSAKFQFPLKQLKRIDEPPLFYVLAVRLADGWGSFIVISRTKLQDLWSQGCGTSNEKSGNLELYITFKQDDHSKLQVNCNAFKLNEYVNAWESLPPLKPLADLPQT